MEIIPAKNPLLKRTIAAILLLVYAWLLFLMLKITLQYVPVKSDIAFLRIKQDYVHLPYYLTAFYIHVFSSIFVLLAGFTQFPKKLRTEKPALHRRMGWLYAAITIFLAGPSGFIIGLHANGGWSPRVAFCLLAVIWIFFTVQAIRTIAKKQVVLHRKWMIRSFALALSAITLRAWKYILVALFHPRPMDVYQIVAWLGWVLNLIIAEIIIYKTITYAVKKPV